jgi:siroheme synthase
MGARTLPGLTAALIAAGRSADTPAAFVSRGAWPEQQQKVVATLATLPRRGRAGRTGGASPGCVGGHQRRTAGDGVAE